MKKDYIPQGDAQLDSWEQNFITEQPLLAAALGLTPAEVDEVIARITAHRGKYNTAQTAKAAAKAAVSGNRSARKDTVGKTRLFVANLKTRTGYTAEIGNQLGVIGPNENVDWTTAKPTLKPVRDGQRIRVDWNKGQADGVVIFSRRLNIDKEFTLLGTDMEPPFYDERHNQTDGVAETREYYAYYLVGDQQRGQRSDVVSITV